MIVILGAVAFFGGGFTLGWLVRHNREDES